VTYSDPQVREYLSANFVGLEAGLDWRESWPLFRANHVIWTPSSGFADRNGSMHYLSSGFLPPSEFLTALKIGRARCLMAWTRSAEAQRELEEAVTVENAMTPEVLFWLSVAYYLERRDNSRMYDTWEELVARYPDSQWAKRTYPR